MDKLAKVIICEYLLQSLCILNVFAWFLEIKKVCVCVCVCVRVRVRVRVCLHVCVCVIIQDTL